jgi:hypothetical protein
MPLTADRSVAVVEPMKYKPNKGDRAPTHLREAPPEYLLMG